MPSPQLTRASSRDAILRVFAELVAKQGFSDTSLSAVADALGLSKGTIVHHFGSKDQILREVFDAYYARRSAEIEFIEREMEDPVRQIAAVIYALMAAHRDDRDCTQSFMREFSRFADDGLPGEHLRRRNQWMDGTVRVIERGIAKGLFQTKDATLTALHIFGMCNYAWTWYQPDGRLSIEEIATGFTRDVLLGMCQVESDAAAHVEAAIDNAIATVREIPGRLPTSAG